jgi:hypothetical protein
MRKRFNNRISLVLYFTLLLAAMPSAACSNAIALDTPAYITPIPDSKPGDQVRYSLNCNLQYFSMVFAWGTVICSCGSTEYLTLQLKPGGQYSVLWNKNIPFNANGRRVPMYFASVQQTSTIVH